MACFFNLHAGFDSTLAYVIHKKVENIASSRKRYFHPQNCKIE
jgi:hypothetical protein